MAWYYHYTDEGNLKLIQQSKKIELSINTVKGDLYGDAVYFTTITPENYENEFIVNKNYSGTRRGINEGKCDWYIKVYIPSKTMKKAGISMGANHEIYLNEGDVDLRNLDWDCGPRDVHPSQLPLELANENEMNNFVATTAVADTTVENNVRWPHSLMRGLTNRGARSTKRSTSVIANRNVNQSHLRSQESTVLTAATGAAAGASFGSALGYTVGIGIGLCCSPLFVAVSTAAAAGAVAGVIIASSKDTSSKNNQCKNTVKTSKGSENK